MTRGPCDPDLPPQRRPTAELPQGQASSPDRFDALVQAVQRNCDIADARHAGDATLCIYLLQMRDFYRWQQGLPWQASLPHEAVGAWIAEREALWNRIEGDPWQGLPLPDGSCADPFDVEPVNAALAPAGLLYGAGQAGRDQTVFFLAERHACPPDSPLPVHVGARELARGLLAPPAALDARSDPPTIVLRRESLARWCWQRLESYRLNPRPGSAFDALLQAHPLQRDFDTALPAWLDEQCDVLVLHELGEQRAGAELGADWRALREALPTRRGELHARALRDHLADLSLTLPTLLERGADAAVHGWFAHYDGLREALYPSLARAYAAWRGGDAGQALREACRIGHRHFIAVAQRAVTLHAQQGAAAAEALLSGVDAVCQGPSER